MNSTPIISARIMRLTALDPPPPTPTTRFRAKFSESDRSGIASPRWLSGLDGDRATRRLGRGEKGGHVWSLKVGRSIDGVFHKRNHSIPPAHAGLCAGAPPLRRDEAQADTAARVIHIRVEQRDGLPRPETE